MVTTLPSARMLSMLVMGGVSPPCASMVAGIPMAPAATTHVAAAARRRRWDVVRQMLMESMMRVIVLGKET